MDNINPIHNNNTVSVFDIENNNTENDDEKYGNFCVLTFCAIVVVIFVIIVIFLISFQIL